MSIKIMSKNAFEFVFGLHAVRQVFAEDFTRILEMWVLQGRTDQRLQPLIDQAQQQGVTVQVVPRKTLDKLSQQGHHQGVVIRCRALPILDQNDLAAVLAKLETPPFLLILDGVQDPHNLGACLRTADAVGIHAVIVPRNRACGLSPTVRKVASGAADTVPLIQVTNLAQTLEWLQEQGVWLVGTDDEAEASLYQLNLTGGLGFILGAEAEGLRHLTKQHCDHLVSIPMKGQVESLNVSVATGVCLYEALRQRLQASA